MKIGIDAIAFSTSRYFLSLLTLATHRHVDYEKYCTGIGQIKMAVFHDREDIVTLAIDAAEKAMQFIPNKQEIDMLIFATESSFDLSKSAGIYVHHFLGLRQDCRVFDMKQACYSATAALQLAKVYIAANPDAKVLIIGSDIVKYSLKSTGEATQGGAAVAMIISQNPRILELESYSGVHTDDVMDFYRPVKKNEAIFDGTLSAYCYLKSLDICLHRYIDNSALSLKDIDYTCFHTPFCKIARKANRQFFQDYQLEDSLIYNSTIGNSCSASLYISLISLLDNASENLSSKRIGFYSYGSGSVAEYFSGIVNSQYEKMITADSNKNMLSSRHEISFEEYENFSNDTLDKQILYQNTGSVSLKSIENHKRLYAR